MSKAPDQSDNLQVWLDYINRVNPREIELGLDRVGRVWEQLSSARPAPIVITVAGTNGKGTCVAALESLLLAAGYRVGCYTSPHIDRFNERIRINGLELDDAEICAALSHIDSHRDATLLSYFEFATLAALCSFASAKLDVVILEVGLGGRLDAVNIVDPDVAIITSISLDHTDWLGADRELIGREKAGIMRAGIPVVCADPDPPLSITSVATETGSHLLLIGEHFSETHDAETGQWQFTGQDQNGAVCTLPGLPRSGFNRQSLSAALQAISSLGLRMPDVAAVLRSLQLPGRFEWRCDPVSGQRLLFDVAHNPGAAASLAQQLRELRGIGQLPGRVAAVLAVMADKDIEGISSSLHSVVDIWYIAQVDEPRCMPVEEATQRVSATIKQPVMAFSSIEAALEAALAELQPEDIVLVTGSFYTVAALRHQTGAMPMPVCEETVATTQTFNNGNQPD